MLKLCNFVLIIDLFVTHFNPHPKAPARSSIFEVLWIKECTSTPYSYVVFTSAFAFESIQNLMVREL
jgi:hypothetical protein